MFTVIRRYRYLILAALALLFLQGLALLDAGFASGLGVLTVLAVLTLWAMGKLGAGEKQAAALFLVALAAHAVMASFIYFADFQPFGGGGGDFGSYHKAAERISYGFWQGSFDVSPDIRGAQHYFPVVIGVLYALTFPSMIIGQLFNVWVASVAIVLLYVLTRELGASRNWALLVGLLGAAYPSYVFYTSLLLKDGIVVALSLFLLLLAVRMLKRFSWQQFALFFAALFVLTNFRFYVGVFLLWAFAVSWLLASSFPWRRRLALLFVFLFLLGFVPALASNAGYLGLGAVARYGNQEQVEFYKEEVYSSSDASPLPVEEPEAVPPEPSSEPVPEPELPAQEEEPVVAEVRKKEVGTASTVDLKTSFESPSAFVSTFFESFAFASLGPFWWQLTEKRHYLTLLETIPWWVLVFFIGKGVWRSRRSRRWGLPLLLFAAGVFGLLAVFFSNFGITTRIRMSAVLALLPFIPFAFIDEDQE